MIVYTIGHSTNSAHQLIAILHQHQISAIGDVRQAGQEQAAEESSG